MSSRLLQPGGTLEAAPKRVAAHNARKFGATVLLTNEAGEHAWLPEADYAKYLKGELTDEQAPELKARQFFRDQLDFMRLAEGAMISRLLDWTGTNVHTVVVTKRCNLKCAYCHASVVGEGRENVDMTVETAKKTVDLIFESPSPSLMIEFQGGEPLLNWPVVKFVVEYARKKNETAKRALHFGLISNFTLLDDEKIDWAIAHGMSFCTSLDGPKELHDRNRIHLGGSTHATVVAGIRRIVERQKAGRKVDTPNAICTVTRQSLPYAREIVDQVVELGLERVQLGPLDPIGFARRSWDAIGYTSKEFVEFYGRALDRVIELNQQGKKCYEKTALIFLIRVLEGGHWRFPNADGVCRLAYDWDGSVYTSEDGRLLAADGDGFFKIGDVATSSHGELLEHPLVRASLLAASRENQPMCFQCAYSPFCTVTPVHSYATQGGVFGRMPENAWCEKMMGLFDVLFDRLRDPGKRKILESWLDYKNR